MVFRAPVPSKEELSAAYEEFPADSWDYVAPPRWQWLKSCIHDLAPNRRVLDVGCFRADFLATIVGDCECHGIEPNKQAAAIAERRGIKIIGSDAMDVLSSYEGYFGTIIMMDVAEHLPDPAHVFRHLAKYLAPNGVLLVLTGNSDHWLARWSMPHYWYMSFPIHLVFLGNRYFKWFARRQGWSIARRIYFSHRECGLWRRFREYEFGLRTLVWQRWLRHNSVGAILSRTRPFRHLSATKSPPLLFYSNDHIGVAFVVQSSR